MTGFTIAAQPDAASHYSSATTGFAFTAHERLRRIYRSCSRCRRLRSRRKTFHPRVSGTAQKPVLRLLRNRTQPRTTRQRLQVLRSHRTNACAGFIALVAAAEGCVRRRSRRKTFTLECQALRRSRFYDCCATGRSLALLVSDYRFCVHSARSPAQDLSLL